MEPKTIREAVEVLQKSIGAVLPGMTVTVNIGLSAVTQGGERITKKATDVPEEIPKDLTEYIDLEALRAFLNIYVKRAGASKAINLVKEFTSGSKDPKDIPEEKYKDLVARITKEYPDMELSFDKEETA